MIIYCRNYVNWIILKSALQVAQAGCYLPNCYCRFVTLWSTMLSCFSIRMLQRYWNISKFLEVCGLGNLKYNVQASFPAEPHAVFVSAYICSNFFECCVRPTEAYWWKQSFSFLDMPLWTPLMSLVVTSRPLACTGLPALQWEHIFQSGSKYFRKICSRRNQF